MDKNDDFLHDRINALVDSRLKPDEQAKAIAQLGGDADALDTLHAWQAQRESLRALHRPLLDEAIPDALLAAARRGRQSRQQLDQWWRWGGMAAAVTLAFGVGWLSHGQLSNTPAQLMAAGKAPQGFIHQASLAHAVYSPEVRHPVEVTAAQQEHLVQWLSKRVGKPLKVPVLASQGYELVGGRLLPGEGGARAQFMFQNQAGLRLTLYLGSVDGNPAKPGTATATPPAEKPNSQETAFRYSADGPVPSFYWVEQGFGYALSGPVSKEELMKLAQLVYQQL
ncbi:MAG: anti-sigma factor [Polaromonas sp.]|uniref:anti-sigma factor family protein n=1 Tax=Polaromonas sp. TaxID=1869339 RepID=UPI0025F3EC7A|nr:anti-sigma factor [Polaromonas sp.]MBI2725121.1 anti-sigma factor [Polaromonas sp.]